MNEILNRIMVDATVNAPVNLTCNLRCSYCDRVANENATDYGDEEILNAISELRTTSSEIVFTGGEPTLNRNLVKFVKASRKMGFKDIKLETNGIMLSHKANVLKLRDAGVTEFIINFPAGRQQDYERITQTPGAWELANRALEYISSAGAGLTISIPILKETLNKTSKNVEYIISTGHKIKKIMLHLVESDDEKADAAELSEELLKVVEISQNSGVEIRLKPFYGPPPCLINTPHLTHSLFELPPVPDNLHEERFGRIPECESCFLMHYCPGIHPGLDVTNLQPIKPGPVFARKVLRQWPNRAVEEQINTGNATQFVLSPLIMDGENSFVEEALLRVNYNCNQRCLFCWIEPEFRNPDHSAVLENIRKLSDYQVGTVCVTGGEPTLNSHLPEYIKSLKTENIRKVCLQTNAVKLGNIDYAKKVVEAGLDFAFVSLHSHDATISDMLTGMEGSFEETVKGILNLQELGATVLLSHVINSFNYESLPEFARFVHGKLRDAKIAFLCAAPIYGAMMHRGLIPKLSDLRKPLVEALETCIDLKVPFSGLATMCGIPLCILDGNPRYFPDMRPVKNMQNDADMLKTDECAKCSLEKCCFGVRKNYAHFYGAGELRAIYVEDFNPPEVDVWRRDYLDDFYSGKFGK